MSGCRAIPAIGSPSGRAWIASTAVVGAPEDDPLQLDVVGSFGEFGHQA